VTSTITTTSFMRRGYDAPDADADAGDANVRPIAKVRP
jgi:hypothetical protein